MISGAGKRIDVDPPLRLEEMRDVRVAVERDAVGRRGDHLVERRARIPATVCFGSP